MLGEMFDNIWIYYQDVTEKWNADNRLQFGVSKDIVADVLRDLGLKIYQSSFGSADLYTALLGVTPSGSDFPFPYMTGSLPAPTGFEYINSSISASNEAVPLEDIEKGTYKRLYHNLPMLLKKKGTTVGLQDLVTVYGIPSTILRVAEFGGKDKDESNDWDYYKQRYNYKFDTISSGWIQTDWVLNSDWGVTPAKSLELRFKTPGINSALTFASQSLWSLDDGSQVKLVLEYTGSGYTSGSYSGSIANPYNEYANLKLIVGSDSASVYLPFFDGDWWSVGVTVDHANDPADFILYAANNIYNGDDGSTIGFIASSSVNTSTATWSAGTNSYFPSNARNTIGTYRAFTGSYQEIRYYTEVITDSIFRDYTMNPDSIESDSLDPDLTALAFRAYLNEFSDGMNARWNSYRYMGRGEDFYVYDGFTRDISVGFTLYAHSPEEMKPIYSKLTYLMSSFAPDYTASNKMRGNIGYLTVGDYIYRQPGIFTDIKLSGMLESNWEISLDKNNPIDKTQYEVPKHITVNLSFKPIHTFLPRKVQKDKFANAPFVTLDKKAYPTQAGEKYDPDTKKLLTPASNKYLD